MGNQDRKDAELIDDLDLLGPIEDSGVTANRIKKPQERTEVTGAGSGLSAERTTIIDAFALTGRRPMLQIISGPDTGKEIRIDKDSFELGRGTANDFVLHDLAVSRKHVKLVNMGETYSMVDMGSGNGSRVNGVRVAELALHDGDEITIGNTVMRFVWPIEATVTGSGEKTQIFAPISQIKKVKETKGADIQKILPWLIYGGGGLIIMTVIIVVVMMAVSRIGEEPGGGSEGLDVLVQRNITAGIADANAGKFADAIKKFQVALTLEPTNKMANDHRAKAEKELENEKAYQNAQKYIADRKFTEAAEELRKIPSDSYFAGRLTPLKDRLASIADTRHDEAVELSDRGQNARAVLKVKEALAIDPESSKYKELLAKLEKASERPAVQDSPPRRVVERSQPTRTQPRQQASRDDEWDTPRRQPQRQQQQASSGGGGSARGLAQYVEIYKGGNVNRAIDTLKSAPEAETAAGKDLLKKMRSFQIMYTQGKNLHSRGAGAQAKKFLEKAAELDREIARGSKYQPEISKMLKSL